MLAVVGAIAALVAIIVVVCRNWSTLVGWFETAKNAIANLPGPIQVLIALLGGPLAAAIVVIANFGKIWGTVKSAVDAVAGAIQRVIDVAGKVAGAVGKVGGLIDKLNPFSHLAAPPSAASAGVSSYGASPYGAPVFAPTINISGDIGDPVLAGRRIVAALESWTAANGRRRIAALVGP